MSEMPNLKTADTSEHRVARRTNLMLSATIESDGKLRPVRIRNLSETGALIEGGLLPGVGAPVVLSRGDLQIEATIAWVQGDRRGVKFDAPTPVHEWTGHAPRAMDAGGLRDQKRVDAIQAEARRDPANSYDPGLSMYAGAGFDLENLDARLADELCYVQRLLDGLGEVLIDEPIVVQRHSRALQSLDLANQILGHIAAIIVADDRSIAVEQIGMDGLRARLRRKPLT